jgi:uncharacterized membrane protein YraQ (UPF0718 family)
MQLGETLLHAFNMALVMSWEIFWALVLGFALSGVIQAVVSKGEMSRLLPDSSAASILEASALGAAASSCSYAATAIARSIFRKGGDFIILPILDIYRKYYGTRIAVILGVVFYAAMPGAAYVIEILFGLVGLVPQDRSIDVMEHSITWNYTSMLDLLALALSAILVWRFMRKGGPEMLAHMEAPAGDGHACHHHGHSHHHHHG